MSRFCDTARTSPFPKRDERTGRKRIARPACIAAVDGLSRHCHARVSRHDHCGFRSRVHGHDSAGGDSMRSYAVASSALTNTTESEAVEQLRVAGWGLRPRSAAHVE